MEKYRKYLLQLASYLKTTQEQSNFVKHEQDLCLIIDSLMLDELYESFGSLNEMIEINRYMDLVDKLPLGEISALNENKFKMATAII